MAGVITNFQAPETLEDLIDRYENWDKTTNLDRILYDSDNCYTNWTVASGSRKGDFVFFYCAATAKQRMERVCKATNGTGNQQLINFAETERDLHKKYSGHIVAWGVLIDDAFRADVSDDVQWKSRWYADIFILATLKEPVPYSAFKPFAPVSSYGAVTILSDEQCNKLQDLIETYNPEQQNDLESIVVVPEDGLTEGRQVKVYGTKYERSPQVRKAFLSLQTKPYQCAACGFSYEKYYGGLGKDYIEVHHRMPLSVNGKEVEIDVANDLVCLCANCHRMIHRRKEAVMTVDELKDCIRGNKNSI